MPRPPVSAAPGSTSTTRGHGDHGDSRTYARPRAAPAGRPAGAGGQVAAQAPTQPPDAAARSVGAIGKTSCQVPAAARRRRGPGGPHRGTPAPRRQPDGRHPADREAGGRPDVSSAFARRHVDPPAAAASLASSSWLAPLTSARTTSPSTVKIRLLTMAPTGQPIAVAASWAVRVPRGTGGHRASGPARLQQRERGPRWRAPPVAHRSRQSSDLSLAPVPPRTSEQPSREFPSAVRRWAPAT